MRTVIRLSILLGCLLILAVPTSDLGASVRKMEIDALSDDPEDASNMLRVIEARREQEDSLISVSPLCPLRNSIDRVKTSIYDAHSLKLGLAFNHVSQVLSEALPGQDRSGSATDMDFTGTWELVCKGTPVQGQLFFQVEGRWDYGTTGPSDLGTVSLGSLTQTANAFAAYNPTFLLRNLYWQQGSREAGWAFRIGKITVDALFSTSAHIGPTTTFLTTAGTGSFANALPDSGLGVAVAWFITDRITLGGAVSDANADRFDWGDIGEGDFYKGLQLSVKICPQTPKAGYSSIAVWHSDGTKNGVAINGSTGREGWGVFIKLEQELSRDGRAIGIAKWGKSFNQSAFYEQLAGGYFLLYQPFGQCSFDDDLFGIGFSWGKANTAGARGEYNLEAFYRFPLFPHVDITLHYQSLFQLALDPTNDQASAFSIRARTVF